MLNACLPVYLSVFLYDLLPIHKDRDDVTVITYISCHVIIAVMMMMERELTLWIDELVVKKTMCSYDNHDISINHYRPIQHIIIIIIIIIIVVIIIIIIIVIIIHHSTKEDEFLELLRYTILFEDVYGPICY